MNLKYILGGLIAGCFAAAAHAAPVTIYFSAATSSGGAPISGWVTVDTSHASLVDTSTPQSNYFMSDGGQSCAQRVNGVCTQSVGSDDQVVTAYSFTVGATTTTRWTLPEYSLSSSFGKFGGTHQGHYNEGVQAVSLLQFYDFTDPGNGDPISEHLWVQNFNLAGFSSIPGTVFSSADDVFDFSTAIDFQLHYTAAEYLQTCSALNCRGVISRDAIQEVFLTESVHINSIRAGTAQVPEPASAALVLAGLVTAGAISRRRKVRS